MRKYTYTLYIKVDQEWLQVGNFPTGQRASKFRERFYSDTQIWCITGVTQ